MLTSAKLRGPWYLEVYILKLDKCVYLRAKFEVSSIIQRVLGRRRGNFTPPPPHLKRTPKKPTQISWEIPQMESF